jgi:hypothetical protein
MSLKGKLYIQILTYYRSLFKFLELNHIAFYFSYILITNNRRPSSPAAAPKNVVGKSITTNPGYFSSGRFLNGEGVKRLLFLQLGSLVNG